MKNKENNIQNVILYEALSALTQKSLEIITKSYENILYLTSDSSWVKQDSGGYVRQEIKQPLWSLFLNKAKGEIENTEEFKVFSEITKVDKIISSQLNTLVGTYVGRSRLELFDVVSASIYSFLNRHGNYWF